MQVGLVPFSKFIGCRLLMQAEASGKPKMAIEKMVEGRLRKYFEDVVLMEQKFIVDDSLSVKVILLLCFLHHI